MILGTRSVLYGQHSRSIFVEAQKAWPGVVLWLSRQIKGGSDVIPFCDHRHSMAVCHGNLQSAGRGPSWPLSCRTRELSRALLFGS